MRGSGAGGMVPAPWAGSGAWAGKAPAVLGLVAPPPFPPKVGFRGHRDAVPSTCCTALSSEQSRTSPFLSLQVLGDPRHLGTGPGASLAWLLLSAAVCMLQAGACGQLLAARIKGSRAPAGWLWGSLCAWGAAPGRRHYPRQPVGRCSSWVAQPTPPARNSPHRAFR